MAITYQAGRRIQGTSDAVANWTDANGTNGTGAGQYDSSNTSGDNSFNYDTVNDRVDFSVVRTSNTPNCMMKDLTSSTNGIGTALSTTDFRIRFKIHWTNWDDKGDVAFFMGLSSFSRSEAINGSNSNDIRKPSGGDSIQIVFDNARLGGAANCWNWMTFGYAENTSTTTNFGGDSTHHALDLEVPNTILSSGNYNCGIPANASTYFCEIIRSGGTTLTLNISKTAYGLSDVSGASNSALGKTTSGTCTSSFGTTRPLKYLFLAKTGGVSSYNNKIEGYMSDIQVQSTGSSSIDRGQLTDVQVGSRFEETDTRKMYHFEDGSPTYETTYPISTGWTQVNTASSYWAIANTTQQFQNRIANNGSGANYDLGLLDSYDEWLLRFELTVDSSLEVQYNGDAVTVFGIQGRTDNTSSVGGSYGTARAQVQMQIATANSTRRIQAKAANDTTVGQSGAVLNFEYTNDTKYYIEVKKTGATSYTIGVGTNSDYTTGRTEGNITATLTGLRYLHFESWGQNASYESRNGGIIENLKFYAGTSTGVMPSVWSQEGT